MQTDPKVSTGNYHARITIKNSKIILIEVEEGREGGVLWAPGFNENGSLKSCMRSIARSWPNLYKKVYKYCRADKLLPLRNIKYDDLRHDAQNLEKDIIALTVKLARKRAKLEIILNTLLRSKNGSRTAK